MEAYISLTRPVAWKILKLFDQNERFQHLFTNIVKTLCLNRVTRPASRLTRKPLACRRWQRSFLSLKHNILYNGCTICDVLTC